MKRKLSYKKMLATVGVLTVVLPMSLSIASCAIKEKQKNNDQKIVNAINQTNYSLDNIIINSTIDELKTNISSDFIKNSLDEINQKNFDNNLFSLNKIINEKNEEINNNDFKKIGLINAKINYNYGKIKNQFVDLKISVKYSDKQIVDAISETTYTVNITMKDSLESINKKINKSEFIKNEIKNNDIKNVFKFEDFKFNKITNNEEDLKQEDLDKWGIINAKIIFNYGEIKNKETLLIININASSEKIVDAINETKYTKKVNFQSSVMELNDSINAEFIKNSLISEIKNSFKNNLFSLNKITNNKEIDLKDEDFTVSGSINAKINYNYGEIKNKETLLIININASSEKIVDAINETKYTKKVNFQSSVMELNDSINAEFIKNSLISEIKNSFKNNLFSLNKITNNKEIDLKDEDFTVSGSINAKINYNYDSFKNLTTNLTIIIGEGQISNKYELNDGKINKFLQISDSIIFAATENGNIWEIDFTNNTKINKYQLNEERINSLIKASNGKVYVGTITNTIWEIDLETETAEKKFIGFGDKYDSKTLIEGSKDKLYVGTGIGNVYELDINTGNTKKYRFDDWGDVNALVKIAENKIYAGTSEGKLWEIDLETKTHKLKYDFKNKSNIIFDIKALSDTELILATKDKIYQYDLIKNEITEKINLKDGKIFSLSIEDLNNKIYATTDNNNVYELDSSFSQVKNKYELNTSVYSSLIVDKKLFAGTITNERKCLVICVTYKNNYV